MMTNGSRRQGALEGFSLERSVSATDKRTSLSEAVRNLVKPGAWIHVAYSDARPNAALLEIVRRFRGTDPRFTLSTAGLVNVQNALVAEGLVERIVSSFVGENYPAPKPSPVLRHAQLTSDLEVENWSLWTLIARLVGGAMGVPFFPVRSLAGSDLADEHMGQRYTTVSATFDGEEVEAGVVRSLRPDLVVMQAVAADAYGNVVLAAPYGEAYWGAMAARQGVLACVEQIVPTEVIREHSPLVRVPGQVVSAVCEVPFGSHPYGLFNPGLPGVDSYGQDSEFMAEVQTAMRDPELFSKWIDEWVAGLPDHDAYLAEVGSERLATLRGYASRDLWSFEPAVNPPAEDGNPPQETADVIGQEQRMVVAASRLIERRARKASFQVMLAGVGFANLAAWGAARLLWRAGHDIQLMAEIGMFGYDPRPGDPFIFSSRNLPSCTVLTDVMGVLGTFVSGPASSCVGVIGAAQVDRHGRINSTLGPDGQYVVGSGGANDIASAAEEVVVIVKHTPGRLVDEVPYVTSPGEKVSAIVTTEGVLERRDGEFVLTSYFPNGSDSREQRIDAIRQATGWQLAVGDDAQVEPDPTEEELALVRQFDPEGTFIPQPLEVE
jgi:acyl CoA:acetate/3-ketoacid CoA transferase alpha subunit